MRRNIEFVQLKLVILDWGLEIQFNARKPRFVSLLAKTGCFAFRICLRADFYDCCLSCIRDILEHRNYFEMSGNTTFRQNLTLAM